MMLASRERSPSAAAASRVIERGVACPRGGGVYQAMADGSARVGALRRLGAALAAPVRSAPSGWAGRGPIQLQFDRSQLVAAKRNRDTTLAEAWYTDLMGRTQQFNHFSDQGLETKDKLHEQFARLDAIEGIVNLWLHTNVATDNATDREALVGLSRQVEREHTRLIGLNLAGGYQLWTRAGSKVNPKIQKLWRSISSGAGNLQVDRANAGAHVAVMAGVAKLLQGAHGRSMLTTLNAPQADPTRRVHVGANWRAAFAAAPGDGVADSYQAGSWAYPNATMQQADAQSHRDGTGTGSHVQVDFTAGGPATGPGDRPIHTPRYITLGHELGHAVHNLAGTARGPGWDDPDAPAGEVNRLLWSNPEEFRNITDHENPLRAEHGLHHRSFHRPPQVVTLTRERAVLRGQFDTEEATVPNALFPAVEARLPAFREARLIMYGPMDPPADWNDPATVARFRALMVQITAGLPAAIAAGPLPVAAVPAPPPPRGWSWRRKAAVIGTAALTLAGAGLGFLAWQSRQAPKV